ncbi:MAG: hypothetical protein Kow0031_33560 [Anaerolineae bacterium]
MDNSKNFNSVREAVLGKFSQYGRKATDLGQKVRHKVFGFRQRSTAHIDRWALPVKILHDHRLVQRRRAFQQSGGSRSSIAEHAMRKARQNQHP